MFARVFKKDKFHCIFASGSAKLWIVIVLILEFVNFLDELLLICNLLIVSGILVFTVPEVTENDIFSSSQLIH